MPTSATGEGSRGVDGRRRARGFTLIELLVAMAIVAAMLGAVVLAFPDSAARRGELAAERAEALLRLACERAELLGRDIGIGVARQQLAFGPIEGGRWQPYPDSPAEALRPRQLDAIVQLALWRDERALLLASELPERPQLACRSSGELTPFELRLAGPEGAQWRLRGGADGGITRERDDAVD